jgi:hypothetical protein
MTMVCCTSVTVPGTGRVPFGIGSPAGVFTESCQLRHGFVAVPGTNVGSAA